LTFDFLVVFEYDHSVITLAYEARLIK
jgi:hypothetical protein